MPAVAACLKVQINNRPAVAKGTLNFNPQIPPRVTMEQSCVAGLLYDYFAGLTEWEGFIARPIEMVMIGDGGSETPPLEYIGSFYNAPPTEGDFLIPSTLTFAGFSEASLKFKLINLQNAVLPLGWEDSVLQSPVEDLQQLIDNQLDADLQIAIHSEPTTLTIHRCTQQDIDNLFQGDHPPHVDMFDSVRFMLTSQILPLNANGYAPAYYDEAKDVIVFKSNYRLTMSDNRYPEIVMLA